VDDIPDETIASALGERRYANHLRVGFNQHEFLLDFAQAYHGQGDVVHTQLVAAPAHVKQFVVLLQGCMADYEARFGAVGEQVPH
jgi:hypothetical protein